MNAVAAPAKSIRLNIHGKTVILVGARVSGLGLDQSEENACERLFKLCNAGSGTYLKEWLGSEASSLSVGDAIWFEATGNVWFCDSVGFKKLTKDQVKVYKNLHPVDRAIEGLKAIARGSNNPALAAHRAEEDLYNARKEAKLAKMDPGNREEAALANFEIRVDSLLAAGHKVI